MSKKLMIFIRYFMSVVVVPGMIALYATTKDRNFFYLLTAYVSVVFLILVMFFIASFFVDEFPAELTQATKDEDLRYPFAINFWYVLMILTFVGLFVYVNSILAGMYFTACVLYVFLRRKVLK